MNATETNLQAVLASPWPRFLFEDIETMSRENLARLQEARLMAMIQRAYEHAPLIRQLWDAAKLRPQNVRSVADFVERAPFTSKDILRRFRDTARDPYAGMLCVQQAELTGIGFTSGTTGDPTLLSRYTEASYAREYWNMGARPGDYVASVLFTFRSGHTKRYFTDLGMVPILFTHTPAELPRFIEASLRFRPTVVGVLSTPLLHTFDQLFERTRQDPVDIFSSYRGALFGGEPLSARFRQLTKSWNLELFETTSVGDVSQASECFAHDGMHVCEDHTIVECLDPNGSTPVRDGEIGEMVVTAIEDHVLPVIRYRTDDLVTMTREPCRCGRTHARIRVMGRKGDLVSIAGRSILPKDILPLLDGQAGISGSLFQISREAAKRDVLHVRVGHDPARAREELTRIASRLRDLLTAELALRVEIELVPEAELLKLGPPHKIPRVVDR
jgi:phenylacetate-CoA ligase